MKVSMKPEDSVKRHVSPDESKMKPVKVCRMSGLSRKDQQDLLKVRSRQ